MDAVIEGLLAQFDRPVLISDSGGRVNYANAACARLYGWPSSALRGLNIISTIPDDHQEEWRDMLGLLGRGEEIKRFGTVRLGRNGRRFKMFLTLIPVRASEGRLEQIIHLAEVPGKERVLSEENLLALKVAHDLRNPLSIMLSLIYLMENGFEERHLTLLKKQLTVCEQVVNNILDFGGNRKPEPKRVSIALAVEEAAASVAMPEHLNLEVSIEQSLASFVDPIQFRQILINLISNAREALSGNSGRIGIFAVREEDEVRLEVRDTGPGIAPDAGPYVFEPLFTTKGKGIGLGLAICKDLVEANSGTISFHSADGETVFTVRLPVAPDAATNIAQE